MNIAKAASAYTKKFFGVSITTYIKQVKAETVNEAFVPEPRVTPRVTTDEPEIHLTRNASLFLWQLRDAGWPTCNLDGVRLTAEAA